MRALKEIRKLLFLVLAAAVFLTIAPIQSVNAGYIKWTSGGDGIWYNVDPEDQIAYHCEGSAYPSYIPGQQAHCSAYAFASDSSSDPSCDIRYISWAYTMTGWNWYGGGTAPGGTLYYDYHAYGDAAVKGGGQDYYEYPSASSRAYSSASGPKGSASGYAEGDIGYAGGTSWVDGEVSPPEAGYFYGHAEERGYEAWYAPEGAHWSFSVNDSDDIPQGTFAVYFSPSCNCEAHSEASAEDMSDAAAKAASSAWVFVYNVSFSSN